VNFKKATETNESEKYGNSPQTVLSVELLSFLTSGFRRDADEVCTLPAYHAAYNVITYRRFGTTYPYHLQEIPH